MNRTGNVQWTWVKAHAGFLLNECADMLATKGVRNETPPANVQYLHPISEDTDFEEYVFADGEIPPVPSNWTGEVPPPQVYTMGNSSAPVPEPVTAPATSTALPSTSPFAVVLSDDDTEEETISWPQPAEDVPTIKEKGPAQALPTIVPLPTPKPLPRSKPTWWSEAWEMLDGIQSEDARIGYLTPMSGEEFRYKCESDVQAIDLYYSRSLIDSDTGESRLATEQDDENQVIAGVLWSDEAITMSAVYGKGSDPNGLHFHHLKRMFECVTNGRGLTLHT
jgi:hypothetical protein